MSKHLGVLFFVPKPVFNQFEVDEFPGLDKAGSSALYRSLLINQMEVVQTWGKCDRSIVLLHQFDVGTGGLDELQRFNEPGIIFYEDDNREEITGEIAEEVLSDQGILIVVNPLVIGLTANDYDFLAEVVDQEDEVTHVARASNGWVSSMAFNYYEKRQKETISAIPESWTGFLKALTLLESRPLVSTSGLVVRSRKDFRGLYDFLSSKESIPACSFEMHDRFTELFVEYKELL